MKTKPIPASKILRAEAARLDLLAEAMPPKGRRQAECMSWAFNLSAAFLDSLGAPERLVRYLPATEVKAQAGRPEKRK